MLQYITIQYNTIHSNSFPHHSLTPPPLPFIDVNNIIFLYSGVHGGWRL